MFLVTILIMNTAASRQKLENAIFQTASIAQKYNCALKRLDFQQEEGLMSSLPIGLNQIEIERGLTTSSTAGGIWKRYSRSSASALSRSTTLTIV